MLKTLRDFNNCLKQESHRAQYFSKTVVNIRRKNKKVEKVLLALILPS